MSEEALLKLSWKKTIKDFCEARDWDQYHTPKDLAIGLITEASELLELFRFVNEQKQLQLLENSEFRQEVSDELADVLFFIIRFSQRYNFDLNKALEQKIIKTAKKYPEPI
jgi:NTP pyrophosphatase (non-canonical NTP hydrolase)